MQIPEPRKGDHYTIAGSMYSIRSVDDILIHLSLLETNEHNVDDLELTPEEWRTLYPEDIAIAR